MHPWATLAVVGDFRVAFWTISVPSWLVFWELLHPFVCLDLLSFAGLLLDSLLGTAASRLLHFTAVVVILEARCRSRPPLALSASPSLAFPSTLRARVGLRSLCPALAWGLLHPRLSFRRRCSLGAAAARRRSLPPRL